MLKNQASYIRCLINKTAILSRRPITTFCSTRSACWMNNHKCPREQETQWTHSGRPRGLSKHPESPLWEFTFFLASLTQTTTNTVSFLWSTKLMMSPSEGPCVRDRCHTTHTLSISPTLLYLWCSGGSPLCTPGKPCSHAIADNT